MPFCFFTLFPDLLVLGDTLRSDIFDLADALPVSCWFTSGSGLEATCFLDFFLFCFLDFFVVTISSSTTSGCCGISGGIQIGRLYYGKHDCQ